jgi:hypothetical protein
MNPKGKLARSQEPAIDPCLEPNKLSQLPPSLYMHITSDLDAQRNSVEFLKLDRIQARQVSDLLNGTLSREETLLQVSIN